MRRRDHNGHGLVVRIGARRYSPAPGVTSLAGAAPAPRDTGRAGVAAVVRRDDDGGGAFAPSDDGFVVGLAWGVAVVVLIGVCL